MGTERCNEIDLIQQTLAGNTSAFDQLVKMHRTTIYVLVLSYIKNPADAEDLTQRIFIRAYERLVTLRELDCFLQWLQQIAHNTCKDWLRRRSESVASLEAIKSSDFTDAAPSAEDIVLKAEIEDIVRKAIDGLKETDRKLMEAHYIDGASYDELQDESGLSYAAIANRLKRAKREVRRRVRSLLGGVMIMPGQTFIWGGFETVKLSVKAKLAAVAVTATIGIGIGGGGVLYHHTSQLGPIVVNKQAAPQARMVAMDPSTNMSSRTYVDASGSAPTNETSVTQTSQIDGFEIVESTGDDGVKFIKTSDSSELPKEIEKKIKESIRRLAANQLVVGDDGAEINAWTFTFRTQPEDMLENLPEEIRRVLEYLKTDGANLKQQVAIDSRQKLPEDVREAMEALVKRTSAGIRASKIEIDIATGKLGELTLTRDFAKEIASGEFPVNLVDLTIQRPESSIHISSTSTDSLPQSTATAPAVESTAIPSGPSKETTPLADEEWTELERLLDITSWKTPPQQNGHEPLNAERQPNVENIPEIPPTSPSEHPEVWEQQIDPSESIFEVSPDAMTEEWHRTMK